MIALYLLIKRNIFPNQCLQVYIISKHFLPSTHTYTILYNGQIYNSRAQQTFYATHYFLLYTYIYFSFLCCFFLFRGKCRHTENLSDLFLIILIFLINSNPMRIETVNILQLHIIYTHTLSQYIPEKTQARNEKIQEIIYAMLKWKSYFKVMLMALSPTTIPIFFRFIFVAERKKCFDYTYSLAL